MQSVPLTLPASSTFTSFNNSVEISARYVLAHNLALALNYGTLPVRLVQRPPRRCRLQFSGRSSLDAGLGQGLPVLVLLYTIFYYRVHRCWRVASRSPAHCCGRSSRPSATQALRRASTWPA